MSLRTRVALIVTATVVVGIGLVSVVAFRSTSAELSDETDRFLRERADEIIKGEREQPRSGGDGRRRDDNDDRSDDNDGNGDDDVLDLGSNQNLPFDADAVIQTLDADGVVTAASGGALPVDATDIRVAQGGPPVLRTIDIDGVPYRLLTEPFDNGDDDGAVQVATAVDGNRNVLAGLRWRLVAVGAAVALIGALSALWVMRRVTRPLEELTAATARVAETHDLTPLGLQRNDEVGKLARSFDEMLVALSLSRRQQQRLVQDAGHELRTPLTSLRANIEFLERADRLPADQRAALLAGLRSEVAELNDLVTEVLAVAADDTSMSLTNDRIDLAEIADEAATRFERRTGRVVDRSLTTSPAVGDRRLIDRAIGNLLGNAHKFSSADSPIELTVDDGTITVLDRGPGFADDDVDRVFDRFYRADEARSLPGSGLGLAIVQRVAEQHGGRAIARNRPDGGAQVAFTIGTTTPTPTTWDAPVATTRD